MTLLISHAQPIVTHDRLSAIRMSSKRCTVTPPSVSLPAQQPRTNDRADERRQQHTECPTSRARSTEGRHGAADKMAELIVSDSGESCRATGQHVVDDTSNPLAGANWPSHQRRLVPRSSAASGALMLSSLNSVRVYRLVTRYLRVANRSWKQNGTRGLK
jgi:hypothetical protein